MCSAALPLSLKNILSVSYVCKLFFTNQITGIHLHVIISANYVVWWRLYCDEFVMVHVCLWVCVCVYVAGCLGVCVYP